MEGEQIAVSWSSGKDSALTLARLLAAGRNVSHLLTTISTATDRVVMHGTRPELVRAQAAAIGLPLVEIPLPAASDNTTYDVAMRDAFATLKASGVTTIAFGDIFLEDVRAYREERTAAGGLKTVFPLWGTPTRALIAELEAVGIDATIICVDEKVLDPSFLGRHIDVDFVASLPKNADPCGENGEYHSFVTNAPYFRNPICVKAGEVVQRQYPAPGGGPPASFSFLDLVFDP